MDNRDLKAKIDAEIIKNAQEANKVQASSEEYLNNIMTFAINKSAASNGIINTIKDLLFFNKSNLRDVADILLYVTGFRNPETIVILL